MRKLLAGGFSVTALNAAVAMSKDTHRYPFKPVEHFWLGDYIKRDTRLTNLKSGYAYPYWYRGFKQ